MRSRLIIALLSDGLIASALVTKIVFDRQLSDLSVELFDFGLVVFDLLCLVGEHARQAVNRLPFPCRHLRRVDFVLGRNLLRRLVTTQRLKGNRGLKLVRKTASRRLCRIPSSLLDTS